MDTPEKDNFLDTIRELRKEADEKLTGNRHYLAIQKLDEIAEAVQQRDMSNEELGAVSEVLRGDGGEAPAVVGDEPVDLLTPENVTPDDEQALPNWWKDKEGGGADGELETAQPDIEPEIEIVSQSAPESTVESVPDSVEESALDLTSVAAGTAVTGVAAAVVADQLSSQTIETGDIAEEIELIDVPEVEIDPVDGDLPAINIEAIEPEIDLPDVAEVEMPEAGAPVVEEIAEMVPEEVVMPEIEIAAIPDIPIPDESAQIADLLSDVDVDTQAVVAAGAAAAAIGTAGIVMEDEPAAPQAVDLVEEPSAEKVEAPEKLSFPSAPDLSEQVEIQPELATAVPAAAILNGDNIDRHPTYGGNRGGILKRFVNSLRGKGYI